MSAVITRGKITRADLALWDGKTATATRVDATGGTVTGLAICNDVDVLQVYGGGTARTRATIAAAVQAIGSTACTLVFATGTWDIDDNLTIPANFSCCVPDGAKFAIATGKTLTLNGHVMAGVYQIFSITGTGAVVFSRHRNYMGYAEWWGAIANDSSGSVPVNNLAYINAAVVALPKVQLLASDYYVSSTVAVETANSWLCGASSLWDSSYGVRGTRVLVTNGSDHTVRIGPSANPGIAALIQGLRVSGISFARSVAPVATSGCTAVRVQYISKSVIEDVRGDESMIGWEFNGCVAVSVYDCWAKRTSAGTGGTDSWKGFYVNGGSGIGAGGNASLRITRSHADDTRTVKTNSTGFLADQKYTDCFWVDCETSQCTTGMEVQGNDSATNDSGNTDMSIINAVNDAFATYGIWVHKVGVGGSVEIDAAYCGPASGATSAIQVSDNKGGSTAIIGGQLVMGAASTCKGITIDALGDKSGGGCISGTLIIEAGSNGAVVMTNVENWRVEPVVQNDSTTGGPAVLVIDACKANFIAPIVKGKASGSTYGIQVTGTTDVRNEYNCSGIDSATIAGGSGNKLVRNAVQITSTGLTGTNLASGVMT